MTWKVLASGHMYVSIRLVGTIVFRFTFSTVK